MYGRKSLRQRDAVHPAQRGRQSATPGILDGGFRIHQLERSQTDCSQSLILVAHADNKPSPARWK
jgi:hypothetical protein